MIDLVLFLFFCWMVYRGLRGLVTAIWKKVMK